VRQPEPCLMQRTRLRRTQENAELLPIPPFELYAFMCNIKNDCVPFDTYRERVAVPSVASSDHMCRETATIGKPALESINLVLWCCKLNILHRYSDGHITQTLSAVGAKKTLTAVNGVSLRRG
jgi:hypothetical protein